MTKTNLEEGIRKIVERETQAWNRQDVDLLLSIFHPDFVWVWPPTNRDLDPIRWETVLGQFDRQRWGDFYKRFFEMHDLIHNQREIARLQVSDEGDGGFAVVDIDTLWRDGQGNEAHWLGRVCKVYTLIEDGWKLIGHTGVLTYGDAKTRR